MTLRFEDTIRAVNDALYNGKLHEAVTLLQPVYDGHPSLVGYEELERIKKDYTMMRDFMLRGYTDPQREQLYARLLHELYRLAANLTLSWRCKNVEAYAVAHSVDNRLNRSHDFIKTVLERFVSDEGMLSLKGEEERKKATEDLHNRHQTFMERLFSALFISLQWTEGDGQFFEELMLSPLVDRDDTLLMLSALTLAVMNVYDERKWVVLANVYRHANDEAVRQRALVGWSLTTSPHTAFFQRQQEVFTALIADETTRAELLELQEQIFYCMNAEKDNATIRKDIFPDMMKGSNLRMGQYGIVEKPEEELNDILHPDADEEAMEKVEQSIERMREMEKRGADVYFGGFVQMKRFPFFRTLSNWFAPYNASHPGLADAQRKVGDSQALKFVLSNGTMCDSDKYSLVLGLGQVFDRLPPNLRDAIQAMSGLDAMPPMGEGASSPTFVRRMYLQNLYRFFRLWPLRAQVEPLFTDSESDRAFFLCAPLFANEGCTALKLSLGQFLLRRGMYDRLRRLLTTMDAIEDGKRLHFLRGCLALHDGAYQRALDTLKPLHDSDHESVSLLRALSKAAMAAGDNLLAYDCLGKLAELQPDNLRTRLNACLAAQKAGHGSAALNSVYELYYNHPDDQTVQRVLAWILLNGSKPAKAQPIYEKLLSGKPEAEDYINAGYARWLAGDVAGACESFGHYPDKPHLEEELAKDAELLARHGITTTDLTLMADAVKEVN